MTISTKLILPADVVVEPVASLSAGLSQEVAQDADDFYVTSPRSGSESIVVDSQTASLLKCFREPSTVIDAVIIFSRAEKLDPVYTLNEAFATLAEFVAERILVPVDSSLSQPPASLLAEGAIGAPDPSYGNAGKLWTTYRYYDKVDKQFSEEECRAIISLQEAYTEEAGKINYRSGDKLRDCHLFWIPRTDSTNWVFARLWMLGERFNKKYGFALSPDMGQAQLTRYSPGQKYDWHMDLGSNRSSLRKISIVLQLSSKSETDGSTEIFYGDSVDNYINADNGDVVIFPSFVMHRASTVSRGIRWSLVIWLTGAEPFR